MYVWTVLLWFYFTALAQAFTSRPLETTRPLRCFPTLTATLTTARAPIIKVPHSLRATVEETQELDLEDVTSELDAVLLVTQEALLAEEQGEKFPFKSAELYDNIDESLDRAYLLVDILERERLEFEAMLESEKEDPEVQMDVDSVLGPEQAKEVLKLLAQGVMNATSFQTLVQERKYATRMARYERLEQARGIVQEKEQQARLLQQEIIRAEVMRLNKEKKANAVAVAFDGSLIGSILGLMACDAFPEYLGDMFPAVPAVLAGGLTGCACVVAFTSDTSISNLMKQMKFGCFGRVVLPLIGAVWSGIFGAIRFVVEAILSIPIGIIKGIIAIIRFIANAIVDAILGVYDTIERLRIDFLEDMEERSRRRRQRRDDYW